MVGTFDDDERTSEDLIRTGRKLYYAVNDKCGPPYDIAFDENYRELCLWADIMEIPEFKY